MIRTALYPGTFDPITNGHLDIIQRSMSLCDRLIVAVAANAGKGPIFTPEERAELVRADVAQLVESGHDIQVVTFDHLLMHFAAEMKASMIIRGLRAVSDFEYEFQMAGMNARLDPSIQTVFLMASDRHQFISSRFVKEIGRLGGEIAKFVSPNVAARLGQRFAERATPATEQT